MSDEAPLTPQQQATKDQKDKFDARVKELKSFEGKTFAPNVPSDKFPNQTFTIKRYNGTGIGAGTGGQLAHLFLVECRNPSNIWNAPATQFLADYHEVAPQPKPNPLTAI